MSYCLKTSFLGLALILYAVYLLISISAICFIGMIKKREKEFPTGLETISMGIAVPHVDSEYAKDSALVLCRFAHPIKFYRMDAIETEIIASIL